MSIRVLIVDDSALMRALLQSRLSSESDIEVVGTASHAQEARTLMKALDPDVVTLDIEMPGMDGLTFLGKIMELRPTPVIIVSGSTQEGTHTAARALQLGAVSCYAKTDRHGDLPEQDGGRLAALVREAAAVNLPVRRTKPASARPATVASGTTCDLIAVGSSTGGVSALHSLLAGFTSDCPPTVIVQHVNACFAPAIARSLDSTCRARVKMAQSDMILERGTIYFAPGGDRHLMIAKGRSRGNRIVLRQGDPISGHRPSVDALFTSAASALGAKATGVLLTGMGQDGAKGLLEMSKAGAFTIAQDEASCVVFGMPRKAIELGAVSKVLPLHRIAPTLFPIKEAA